MFLKRPFKMANVVDLKIFFNVLYFLIYGQTAGGCDNLKKSLINCKGGHEVTLGKGGDGAGAWTHPTNNAKPLILNSLYNYKKSDLIDNSHVVIIYGQTAGGGASS